ncbi:tRNA (N(6)-L-threonylcarbamoyladenosine(37)-C(2))-methylthiotransferase MtaB [Flavonifractor sp. DFI.6.63]|uniref:tRNA (N(6)-L-threonylcarbamoyladenosine(37)-C(2))- methylthiotransferase MtaB n=1 Tax=Oscillospiraceae TaxID=216572 RepID=UPI00210DE0D3|nr:tRNA (N(6)-L-threonylcarbamoyladenosine(37)-C(2))-methylthiotransferase MtaB [Flavonifractor sp. DFI.6.63]MBS1384535.1 tRNA (N(6)-L-threonylcarbamoyladenosine(37)-C(2))-methylthiotransferase MtaB [Flavonifractor sp.]MCQ5029406.1 tRNA (N(6)-L-threonylcarbamoyladenosine(37)-C(2))-methylthiotransferase MtaB [Flavonifractor sp. DFI.6.63]MDU2195027.1 tRNA (N(6)-L-threonylcarbamoyladenosine(37)-C(2))-methylthiotransferase MtaB [Clostridiales bacterium]
MRVAIYTLGCKVNQYETQALETELERRGHTLVPFTGEADAYIINTCTVTAVSDQKSRQTIRQARKRAPRAVVAVCGCYAQTAPEAVRALEVDLVMGTGERMAFLDALEDLARARQAQPLVRVDDALRRRTYERLSAGGLEGRTRAMLKVEDGCVNFCTYCIIPYARGPIRSLPLADAVCEAKRLAGEGYRELVLTGIEISSWGADFRDGSALIDLVEALCAAAPECRVRLGSLEPRTVTEEFCRRAAALPNLCPHFHLSLQSGCDATLRRMGRKYDCARYYESVKLLWDFFDRPGITTDLIVGFPGETEEEFAQTLAFLSRCAFSAMHIFPYSRRSGTPAASMPGQCPNAVKQARARQAAQLAGEMRRAWLERWVGRTLSVLFEEEKDGLWRGHAPNYTEVLAPGSGLHNVICDVEITGVREDGLLGRLR